jgi:hypothetical protein
MVMPGIPPFADWKLSFTDCTMLDLLDPTFWGIRKLPIWAFSVALSS